MFRLTTTNKCTLQEKKKEALRLDENENETEYLYKTRFGQSATI